MSRQTRPSLYDKFLIDKDGTTVDIKNAVTSFSYYESLFSPNITANVTFVDTGNSLSASSEQDTQERVGTVFSSLPIRGKEAVKIIVRNESGTLDFDSYPLYVTAASVPQEKNSKQIVFLNLSSESAIKNESKTIYTKYYNNIGNTVRQILTDELQFPSERLVVENTSNSYAFTGSSRRPFDLVLSLAPKSVPVSGAPGYFFWETQQALSFRSVDSLVKSAAIASYVKSNVVATAEDSNNKILSYNVSKNQNILTALRAGVYKTKNVFFNPFSLQYDQFFVSLSETGFQYLGNSPEYPGEFESGDTFTRTNYFVLDTGNMEVGISTSINNDPRLYQAKAIMRYNILFTQMLNVVVPSNLQLQAGKNVEINFPKVSQDDISSGVFDENLSGKYLIVHLAHHFTPEGQYGSTTHMTLARDTYGLYTGGGT